MVIFQQAFREPGWSPGAGQLGVVLPLPHRSAAQPGKPTDEAEIAIRQKSRLGRKHLCWGLPRADWPWTRQLAGLREKGRGWGEGMVRPPGQRAPSAHTAPARLQAGLQPRSSLGTGDSLAHGAAPQTLSEPEGSRQSCQGGT